MYKCIYIGKGIASMYKCISIGKGNKAHELKKKAVTYHGYF